MGNKAIVFICVDGPSDIDSLRQPFEDLFDTIGQEDVELLFRHPKYQGKDMGDVTSMDGVTTDNIEKTIYKYFFKGQDKQSTFGWQDVTTIIHIIDLDGAYVDADDIKLFTAEEEAIADSLLTNGEPKNTLYLSDHIAVRKSLPARQDILQRKRKNIEYLLSLSEISVGKRKVRYMLYYFSCNLDHFIHGDANMTGYRKMQSASAFSGRVTDADGLVAYFSDNEFCTATSYEQSWQCLRKGCVSLQRGSNVHLLIEKIRNSSVEDWA